MLSDDIKIGLMISFVIVTIVASIWSGILICDQREVRLREKCQDNKGEWAREPNSGKFRCSFIKLPE